MIKRPYGKTGIDLSVIGFGGILVMDETPEESSRLVSQAIDWGINYFDVAPSYGNAQECLGPALEPYRKEIFLACKSGKRSAEESQAELNESLKLLRTDYLDLYQLHAVTSDEDVEQILAPGGAMETLRAAKDAGVVRHLGFSAHSETAAIALMDAFAFDSILFPVNWVTWNTGKFGARVVDAAVEKGMAILALKSLAKRQWTNDEERKKAPKAWYHPVESYEEAKMAVKFTLSRPVTAAVSPGHEHLIRWAVQAAEEFEPITPEEEQLLAERARELSPIFAV
jgi:predicted aldo/keto reductase-like oxidoreductase